MTKLTIFTPTYNRGYIIENLYRSLQRQKIFDFEWVVINDGSTDNTHELFRKWVSEDNKFKIRYFRQNNVGLVRSFNKGIIIAQGEYLAKIDSDDYITDNFMDLVFEWLNSIKGEDSVYAVSGLKATPDGIPLKGVWPDIDADKGYIDSTELEKSLYKLDADNAEVWRTNILRKYPFQIWGSEEYVSQEISFNQIALDGYKIRWFPKVICVCEYLEDGMTKNGIIVEKNNPIGFAMLWNHKLKYKIPYYKKFYCACQMIAMLVYGRNLRYLKESNNKVLTALALPFGATLAVRRYIQFSGIWKRSKYHKL